MFGIVEFLAFSLCALASEIACADELDDAMNTCNKNIVPRQALAPGLPEYKRGWPHCAALAES
jgi:hypothetical protein